jgi:hypothetical protein
MINASKVEIIDKEGLEIFEIGRGAIGNIGIDEENQIIKIKYDSNSDWKYLVIPFSNLLSFHFK